MPGHADGQELGGSPLAVKDVQFKGCRLQTLEQHKLPDGQRASWKPCREGVARVLRVLSV